MIVFNKHSKYLSLGYWRIRPFRVVHMVRQNAVFLDLGSAYYRLHLVLNVSLLTLYVDPRASGRPLSLAPLPAPRQVLPPPPHWRHLVGILDFCVSGRKLPGYLLCWVNGQ